MLLSIAENMAIEKTRKKLISANEDKAVVLVQEFANQINCPPIAVCIEKYI